VKTLFDTPPLVYQQFVILSKNKESALVGSAPSTIVLLEDDADFAAELSEYLRRHGFDVRHVTTLPDLLAALAAEPPDLLVLDQFLAVGDALAELPAIRGVYSGGLVFLTGNTDATDRVLGLELGADDFMVKTTPPREIVARLRSVIRRANRQPSGWTIDRDRRTVIDPSGRDVHLTAAEFAMLAMLDQSRGEAVSRELISQTVLHRPHTSSDRAVDNLVLRVRSKLATSGVSGEVIKSVRSAGYVFVGFPPSG
jgi:two-component system OmpR family response regulator